MKRLLIFVFIFSAFLFGCSKPATLQSVSKNCSTYSMDITFSDNYTLSVNQTINFKNNSDTKLAQVFLHLYPNNFATNAINKPVGALNRATAYPKGESAGGIDITRVHVQEKLLNFELQGIDKEFLAINLGTSVHPSDTFTFSIEYVVTLPEVNHRFGYGANTVNMANFYPILAVYEKGEWILDSYNSNGDPFYSDVANYNVSITAPSEYVLATSGNLNSTTTQDGTSTHYVSALAIRDYAFVLSKRFDVATEMVGDVCVSYYHYDDERNLVNLQTAVDSLKTFNRLFGEYPYSTLNVVKCNFLHGGMEYPNLVYISDSVTNEQDYTNVIIHEIAHQWWYGVVGSNAYRTPWLDEGLTEFSTLLFYEENPNYSVSLQEVVKESTNNYVTFLKLYTSIMGEVDTSMNRNLNQYTTEHEYVYVTYVKGMLFFNSLRELVGKKTFIASLQQYYDQHKFENVTPHHLLSVFEKNARLSLSGFFNSWINGDVKILSIKS